MRILIGVTGGIAAYKTAELVRLLRKEEAEVRVVMTSSAQAFVSPLTFQALSQHCVYSDLFSSESKAGMDHITLARWPDQILIAPASADFIGSLATGRADDLLTTLCLVTHSPLIIAPAMNESMYLNPAIQKNLDTLKQRGIDCWGPDEGAQACGDIGLGRMLEPKDLFSRIQSYFELASLKKKKVLITAGPTREYLDPIRYFTNQSTGHMGFSLAVAADLAGAYVTLISGPTELCAKKSILHIPVLSAVEMYQAVFSHVKQADIFISAAALADYRPKNISSSKIKKSQKFFQISLVRNPDILKSVSELSDPPFTVGFAAETQDLITNARKKLKDKKLDLIVANEVGLQKGFGGGETSVTIIDKSNNILSIDRPSKASIAKVLIRVIGEHYSL